MGKMRSYKRPLAKVLGLVVFGSVFSGFPAPASANAICTTTTETFVSDGITYVSQIIADAGTCDWSVPDGVSAIQALLVAGGGGGGGGGATSAGRGGGGGGGAGQVGYTAIISVNAGDLLTVVVGAGGAAGSGGINGGAAATDGGDGEGTSITHVIDGESSVAGGTGGSGASGSDPDFGGTGGAWAGGIEPGAEAIGRQGGQGASQDSNVDPIASTNVKLGESFAGWLSSSLILGNGGGGGDEDSYGSRGTTAGSGGGGGRGSLNLLVENYGYSGSAGLSGMVIIKYILPPVGATANAETYEGPLNLSHSGSICSGSDAVVTGQRLNTIEAVYVGDKLVPHTLLADGRLSYSLKDIPGGNYTAKFWVPVNSINLTDQIRVTTCSTSPVVTTPGAFTATKLFANYRGDKGPVVARDLAAITSFIRQYPGITTVTCVGSTSGVPAKRTDPALARTRAKNACDAVQKLVPNAKITLATSTGKGIGQRFRSVTVTISGTR